MLLLNQFEAFAGKNPDKYKNKKSSLLSEPDTVVKPMPRSYTSLLSDETGLLFSKKNTGGIKRLTINGYYRFYSYHRYKKRAYSYTSNKESLIELSDQPLSEPTLLLNIAGRTKVASFHTDLMFLTPYRSDPSGAEAGNIVKPKMALNFYSTMRTSFGNYTLRLNGLHWYELSTLTFGAISKDGRWSIWERTPWEVPGRVVNKYQNFYESGTVTHERWGKKEFQGVIVEGYELPKNFTVKILYGKTGQNGGFRSVVPNWALGGSLIKSIGTMEAISFNTFNNRFIRAVDSMRTDSTIEYNIHTIAFNKTIKGFNISGEAGIGSYMSPTYDRSWSEGIMMKLILPLKYTKLPVELNYFRLGKNFVNKNAGFSNSSIRELEIAQPGQSQTISNPFAGPMIGVDDIANNRQGLNIGTEFNIGKLKINIANGFSKELDSVSNAVSFGHRVTRLAMVHTVDNAYWDWWKGGPWGPYGRVYTYHRGVYEEATINDPGSDGIKSFNVLEFQAKYKSKVLKKALYLFYSGSANSAQADFSIIPIMSKNAYVHTWFHEFDVYYQLTPSIMFTGYFGVETIICNDKTDQDLPTSLVIPEDDDNYAKNMDVNYNAEFFDNRHQVGFLYGIGFDIYLAKNMGLYLRHRIVDYEDRNFPLDVIKAHETTAELRIHF